MLRFIVCALLISQVAFAQQNATGLKARAVASVFPDFDELIKQIDELNDKIGNLTLSIDTHAGTIEAEWQKSNQQIEAAVDIVNERYTVGTLVGIALGVGLAPALVNLACLPVVYLVARQAVRNNLAENRV